jgi:NADPH-dependent ferric siderophore reductase
MGTIRTRREPPTFRLATVVGAEPRSERLVRLTIAGEGLAGFDPGLPAASVRLLVPDPSERSRARGTSGGAAPGTVALPTWNGNEFLRADGSRPPIRTLTPLRFDPAANELDVEVVLHGAGPLSTWAADDPVGDPTAISGTGRGYAVDPDAPAFVLAGDESAVPAISVLLDALARDVPGTAVRVVIETDGPGAEVALPAHPRATVSWQARSPAQRPGDVLAAAIADLELAPGTRLWVAGEAAGVHRIRQHLFEVRSVPRAHAVVRGYWKVGRGGDADL